MRLKFRTGWLQKVSLMVFLALLQFRPIAAQTTPNQSSQNQTAPLQTVQTIGSPRFNQEPLTAESSNYSEDSSIICLTCNELQESPKLKKALQKLHNVRVNNLAYIIQEFPNQTANQPTKKGNMPPVRTINKPGTNPAAVSNSGNINPKDTLFTILHIGDSHIQGDYFSGEIRMQLQSMFGNAGRGILFPYALAKSFGPRGVSVKPLGVWTGYKTLTGNLTEPLGVSGYGASTRTVASSLQVSLTEKFKEENALGQFSAPQIQKINIWHSADNASFITQLNPEFQWTGSQFYPAGWGVSSYQAAEAQSGFTLSLSASAPTQNHYGFYGFEIVPMQQRGVVYHHCGVVGAQFTHLINKAPYTVEQIAHIKPDILIFSFGTNEAYNGKLDSQVYTPAVNKFLADIAAASPTTAIIITTAPDTRSRNRIPPQQINVNNQLRAIAKNQKATLYDLNEAMGGWGSLHVWYYNKLTLTDKLHFNAAGYALQGQLFTLSLLQAYNKVNAKDTLNIQGLRTTVHASMKTLVRNFEAVSMSDSMAKDSSTTSRKVDSTGLTAVAVHVDTLGINQRTPATPNNPETRRNPFPARPPQNNPTTNTNSAPRMQRGEVTHTVKSGENLYRIAQKYHVSHEAIAKRNHLTNPRSLRPGQRLVIPAR
jgi:LysM repeat protein